MLESVLRDAWHGARLLRRAPLFALVTTASIAFGLGGGLAIFTVANAMLLRPIVPGGKDIYRIYTGGREGSRFGSSSFADYRDFARAQAFSAVCVTDEVRANVSVGTAAAAQDGAVVSDGCFRMFGLQPHLGRLIATAGANEAVIGYALWKRRFAMDPSVVGRNILVNGVPATIVGVAPRGFAGTTLDGSADFWVPIERFASLLGPRALEERRARSLTTYARLRDGVSQAQAEAELTGIAASLHAADPAAWSDSRGGVRRVTVMRELDARFASAPGAVPAMLLAVSAAIAVIVSIACVNIATMLLARGAGRTRELTIRLAIGASRSRLLRQLATETLLIAVAGGVLAIGAVSAAVRVAQANWPEGVPAVSLAVDWRVTVFAIVVALAANELCGLLPAMHVVWLAIAEGMKGRAARFRSRWMRAGTREALIVVQVTVSIAALYVSALFVRGLMAGAAASPGFATEGVMTMAVDLGTAAGESRHAIAQRIVDAVAAVPNVDTPSVAVVIPLTGSATGFSLGKGTDQERVVDGNAISPGYLNTMGIALRRGRDFTRQDRQGAAPVAIVSEAMARAMWNTTDVVGRIVPLDRAPAEVVGVVADTKYRSVNEPYPPLLYIPFAQSAANRFIVHARVRGGGETLAAMDAAARSVDPRVMIDNAAPISSRLEAVRLPERLSGLLGAAAGAIQFALVLMALWALVAYAVERRTREIGIRMALGATGRSVVSMLIRPAMLLIAAGAVLGSAIGLTIATVMQSEFIGLGALEPLTGVPIVAVMAAVAGAAALIPARRAARVDPMLSLRAE